jgi:outer membrane protein TolC
VRLCRAAVALALVSGCATRESAPGSAPAAAVPEHIPSRTLQPTNSAGPLTLDEAIERAQICNSQLEALRGAVRVAKERRSAATDIPDPEALAAWGSVEDEFGGANDDSEKDSKWRAGFRVYVPNPFEMAPRASARTADVMAAKADLQAASWLVECDARRWSAELDFLAQDIALAQNLVDQTAEILRQARLRSQQGAATAVDVVAAAQRQLQAQNDLDSTRSRYRVVRRNLAALLNLPPASMQLATNPVPLSLLPESSVRLDSLESAALKCRGDLSALHWRALTAKSAFQEARNERIPWVKNVTAWHRDPADDWWVGLAVTVPIFTWTKNHASDALLAQDELAEINEANGVKLVYREVRDAMDELAERRNQQARNQGELMPLLAEMRETLQVLRNSPATMPLQVATIEAQILESARLELDSRWQYHLALLNLERAVGEPLSAALGNAPAKP